MVDWHRLDLKTDGEIDRFLRVNEFDVQIPEDISRLERLRTDAVEYMRRTFSLRIPPDLARDVPARQLLRIASGQGRRQLSACMILKVMHIIYHLEGHELHYKLPVSSDELSSLVEAKAVQVVDEIRAAGLPVVEFSWSRKPRDSLVTKLLSKMDTFASQVFDKLRFRIIVRGREDVLPLLWELQHRLIPFNYVVPGESINTLIRTEDLLRNVDSRKSAGRMPLQLDSTELTTGPVNEFSSPDYRIINFVADLPVRVEVFLNRVPEHERDPNVTVSFVLAEFQIADWATAQENERGDSAHDRYKQRQLGQVTSRLARGRLNLFKKLGKKKRRSGRSRKKANRSKGDDNRG